MSFAQHPTQYIVRLKNHVDMHHHIQLFDRAHNGPDVTLHKVAQKLPSEFTNAYVG